MVLDNFRNIVINLFLDNTYSTHTLTNLKGDSVNNGRYYSDFNPTSSSDARISSPSISMVANYDSANTYGLLLGTGDDTPTQTDYKLSSVLDPSGVLKRITRQSYRSAVPNFVNITELYKNTSDEDITVKEVSIAMECRYTSDSTFLCTRQVISPVTIKAGEFKAFTVSLDWGV